MFTLKRIRIQNFRILEYFDSADVAGALSGLVYIGGSNTDYASADSEDAQITLGASNGAGKTTLGTAITWCTHGCDLTGQSLTDVIRYGETHCHVTVWLSDPENGRVVKITRRRDSNRHEGRTVTLTVREKRTISPVTAKTEVGTPEEVQSHVDALLGQQELFLAAHVFGYGERTQPFALRSDAEQKQLFNLIIDAADLDAAWNETSTRLTAVKRLLDEKEREHFAYDQVLELRTEVQTDASSTLRTEQLHVKFLKKQQQRIDARMELLSACEGACDSFLRLIEDSCHPYRDMVQDKLKPLEAKFAVDKVELMTLRARHDVDQGTLHELRQRSHSPQCTLCGHVLDQTEYKALEKEVSAKCEKLLYEIQQRSADLETLKDSIEAYTYDLAEFQLLYAQERRVDNTLLDAMHTLEMHSRVLQSRIDDSKKRMDEQQKKDQALADRLSAAAKEKKRVAHEIKELTTRQRYLEFLAKAFGKGGIRAYRLDLITPELNAIANQYAQALFDCGMTVRYSTQRELKGGGYREAFTVSVLNEDGTEHAVCSAGEAMRRDIVHTFTMAELASRIGKRTVSFMLFDEAFRSLDMHGTQRALDVLNASLNNVNVIWVIEHNAELAASFDKALVVIRKEGASHVQWHTT